MVITSRSLDSLADFQSEIEALGRRAVPVELDVQSYDSIQQMAQKSTSDYGKIDILVNNAGCNVRKPALEVSWEDWNLVLDTNLRGTFFVAQAIGRGMVEQGSGRVINIGSVTSVAGYAGLGPYCASRGGVKQLTMSLADDWGPSGVDRQLSGPRLVPHGAKQGALREPRMARLPDRSNSLTTPRPARRFAWIGGVSRLRRQPIRHGTNAVGRRGNLHWSHSCDGRREVNSGASQSPQT